MMTIAQQMTLSLDFGTMAAIAGMIAAIVGIVQALIKFGDRLWLKKSAGSDPLLMSHCAMDEATRRAIMATNEANARTAQHLEKLASHNEQSAELAKMRDRHMHDKLETIHHDVRTIRE